MLVGITVPRPPQQGEIGLGFRSIVQHDRILHTHHGLAHGRHNQQLGQRVDCQRVAWPDRGHVNQLPFQQFDAVVLTEHAGLGQAVIVAYRQAMPRHLMAAQDVRPVNVVHAD